MGKLDTQSNAPSEREHVAWIFQSNPKDYKLDDYLSLCTKRVYWEARQHAHSIKIGDRAFIWRAQGISSIPGIVASGVIVDGPLYADAIAEEYKEALGKEFWLTEQNDGDKPQVGIELDSVRLSIEEGMLQGFEVGKALQKFKSSEEKESDAPTLRHTVNALDGDDWSKLEILWGKHQVDESVIGFDISDLEGAEKQVAHRRRERSQYLIRLKKEEIRRLHGTLCCEVCAASEKAPYPEEFSSRIFEVHHLLPLSEANSPRISKLCDLAVVCANCHRAIHATKDVEQNMLRLKKILAK